MKTQPPTGPFDSSSSSNNVPVNWVSPAAESAAGKPVEGDGKESPARCNPAVAVTSFEASALSLTEPQRTAIIRLTSGATRVDAATAAGVTRTTLYRWLNHDPAFQAAYNAWQKDLITTAQGQLLAASQDAVAAVLAAVRRGDARLSWKLLTSLGLAKPPKPGSTDLRQLQRQEEMDRKREEIAERKEVNKVLEDDMSTIMPFESPLE